MRHFFEIGQVNLLIFEMSVVKQAPNQCLKVSSFFRKHICRRIMQLNLDKRWQAVQICDAEPTHEIHVRRVRSQKWLLVILLTLASKMTK